MKRPAAEDKPLTPTGSQKRAIEHLEGRLFIPAGAGSGKTAVVARRFVYAIAGGAATVDEILTITFTRKAAAEMMRRIRKELREQMLSEADPVRVRRMSEAYRGIERARISTIDSFCSSVLRANVLAAGLDPDFTTADANQAAILSRECFESCLYGFVLEHGDAAADLITAYDAGLRGNLFNLVDGLYRELRSRGQDPGIPLPDVNGLMARAGRTLTAAMDDFEAAVRREGASNATVDRNLEAIQGLRQALEEQDPNARARLVLENKPGGNAGKVREECRILKTAWEDYLGAARAPQAYETLRLFNMLLNDYDSTYQAEKYIQGLLDFADLSLYTRDLLRRTESVRERLASGFKFIMVDEFQDTNPLQHEIIEMIARDNLMMVGDANQSIFGYRDAEVGLFREEDRRAREEGYREPLLENFRSQPEILAFVDRLFRGEDMLAPDYLKLIPEAEPDANHEDFRVEVIMVDQKPPGREKKLAVGEARRAEAHLIAERLQEIFQEGLYSAKDAAILVQTRKDVEFYRDALERLSIKNYLAIGVGLYQRLEMGDAINMFRLLVNPLDDEALTGVLRSPMAGVSDDALFWMRQAAGREDDGSMRPLWRAISDGRNLKRFAEQDRVRLARFVDDLEGLRETARRQPLAEVARRIIGYNDYAAAVAAGGNGKQALANLMKLVDLAADYEAAWGRDLADFTDFLVNQKSEGAKEAEPPTEEEGVDAVRIMTMHTAKGLEFPLVVLPKLADSRGGNKKRPDLLLGRDIATGRVGLKLRTLGEEPLNTFNYEELQRDLRRREDEEEKRLHYVAMTRAKRHLILVGYAAAGEKPKRGSDARPFDWIRALLELDHGSRPGLDELDVIREIEGVNVGLRVCSDPDDVLRRAQAADAAREFEPPPVSADITARPQPAAYHPPVVSPTALDSFSACPRRYYLDNVLRVRDLLDFRRAGAKAAEGCNLSAADMGTLVHSILETDLPVPGAGPVTPGFINERAAQVLSPDLLLTAADHEQAIHLVNRLKDTDAAREIFRAAEAGRLRRELSFSTLVGETILQGKMDVLVSAPAPRPAVVVDYKTGSPGEGRTAEEAAAAYRYQMTAYALAACRIHPGPVKVVLVFLGGDRPVEFVREYGPADASALEEDLQKVIGRMGEGDFPRLPAFDERQCPWCAGGPNGARLCHNGG